MQGQADSVDPGIRAVYHFTSRRTSEGCMKLFSHREKKAPAKKQLEKGTGKPLNGEGELFFVNQMQHRVEPLVVIPSS